jgi:hypothetical protein
VSAGKAVTLRGPRGYTLTLDPREVDLKEPGNGTPAMVNAPFGHGSATYGCATSEGEVTTDRGGTVQIPPDVLRWLDSQEVADRMHEVLPDVY